MESSDPFVNGLMLVESALNVSYAGAHESETLTAAISTSADLTGGNTTCIKTK